MQNFEMERRPQVNRQFILENKRNMAAFWILGLLNNSSYVIMIAGANSINASGVGIVYLCAVIPGLCIKLSAPYWFHKCTYASRILAASVCMSASYLIVALSSARSFQLSGVVFASLQGGLCEATCLALTSHYSRSTITMWSSGTGFAGVFGYAWIAFFTLVLRWSFSSTVLTATLLCVVWLATFFLLLESPDSRIKQVKALVSADAELMSSVIESQRSDQLHHWGLARAGSFASDTHGFALNEEENVLLQNSNSDANNDVDSRRNKASILEKKIATKKMHSMTHKDRFRYTLLLWPYTIPLFLVYFAEYSMQAGTWASIGFPVANSDARHTFYIYSNWAYQIGVFLSRSSGILWEAERRDLWAMPLMQIGFLVFFFLDAIYKWWYNWWLLMPCFVTGILGGLVYVNAFTLLSNEVEPQLKEFSLSAASVADSIGIAFADVFGVVIQGCLFKFNGISGADFTC